MSSHDENCVLEFFSTVTATATGIILAFLILVGGCALWCGGWNWWDNYDSRRAEKEAAYAALNDRGTLHVQWSNRTTQVFNVLLEDAWNGEYRVSERDFELLGTFDSVRNLVVKTSSSISSDAWANLTHFPQLQGLSLEGVPATDDDLVHLSALNDLRIVQLVDTKVTGEGLKHLAALPRLEELVLVGKDVNDAACRELAAFKALREVRISGTQMSKEAVMQLQHMTGPVRVTIYNAPSKEPIDALRRIGEPKSIAVLAAGDTTYASHDLWSQTSSHGGPWQD